MHWNDSGYTFADTRSTQNTNRNTWNFTAATNHFQKQTDKDKKKSAPCTPTACHVMSSVLHRVKLDCFFANQHNVKSGVTLCSSLLVREREIIEILDHCPNVTCNCHFYSGVVAVHQIGVGRRGKESFGNLRDVIGVRIRCCMRKAIFHICPGYAVRYCFAAGDGCRS